MVCRSGHKRQKCKNGNVIFSTPISIFCSSLIFLIISNSFASYGYRHPCLISISLCRPSVSFLGIMIFPALIQNNYLKILLDNPETNEHLSYNYFVRLSVGNRFATINLFVLDYCILVCLPFLYSMRRGERDK